MLFIPRFRSGIQPEYRGACFHSGRHKPQSAFLPLRTAIPPSARMHPRPEAPPPSGSVTGADGYPLKPAPDALLAMMTRYGLQAADCVMVGDRDIDLDAGKNAGMAGILFDPDGFYPDYPTPWRYASMTDMRKAIEDKEGEKQ